MTDRMKVIAIRDGKEVDVTEGVAVMYDCLHKSLDWGSGFLTIEDVTAITDIAGACGFVPIEEAEKQRRAYVEMVRPTKCPECGHRARDHYDSDLTAMGPGGCSHMTCECKRSQHEAAVPEDLDV